MFFKNQKGQATLTEIIIILGVVVGIAGAVFFSLSGSISQVDAGYKTKTESFFMQGE